MLSKHNYKVGWTSISITAKIVKATFDANIFSLLEYLVVWNFFGKLDNIRLESEGYQNNNVLFTYPFNKLQI